MLVATIDTYSQRSAMRSADVLSHGGDFQQSSWEQSRICELLQAPRRTFSTEISVSS